MRESDRLPGCHPHHNYSQLPTPSSTEIPALEDQEHLTTQNHFSAINYRYSRGLPIAAFSAKVHHRSNYKNWQSRIQTKE